RWVGGLHTTRFASVAPPLTPADTEVGIDLIKLVRAVKIPPLTSVGTPRRLVALHTIVCVPASDHGTKLSRFCDGPLEPQRTWIWELLPVSVTPEDVWHE